MNQDATQNKLGFTSALAVGLCTTSPAYSFAAILGSIILAVGLSAPLIVILGFIPMACTAMGFVYLNKHDPDCGTTFSWVSRAIGPNAGWIAGWAIITSGALVIGSLANFAIQYSLAAAQRILDNLNYTDAAQYFGQLSENRILILIASIALLVGLISLSILGGQASEKLQNILTFAQIIILLAFGAILTVKAFASGRAHFSSELFNPFVHGAGAFTSAILLSVFAFWGWESAVNLNGETKTPETASRAGLVSTFVLLVTYVLVALGVALYSGASGVHAAIDQGDDLVIPTVAVDAFGPLAWLMLFAVASSAFASTQTTLIPGSRAILSMARRGAAPSPLSKVSPRFKTPYASLIAFGVIIVSWLVFVTLISENAMLASLSAIGILVAFYYSLTGIACVFYYRKHLTSSVKAFFLVGVAPLLGATALGCVLLVSVEGFLVPDEGESWMEQALPLVIAIGIIVTGIVLMLIQRGINSSFWRNPREAARWHQEPVAPPRRNGRTVILDANGDIKEIERSIETAISMAEANKARIVITYGIAFPGEQGEESSDMQSAIAEAGAASIEAAESLIKTTGAPYIVYMPNLDAEESLVEAAKEYCAVGIVTAGYGHGSMREALSGRGRDWLFANAPCPITLT